MKNLAIIALTSLPLFAQAGIIERLEGKYESRHLVGIVYRGDFEFEDGGSTLLIENLGDNKAKFSLSSVQSNAHSCDIEGTVTAADDQLTYTEAIEGQDSCRLEIREDADALRLRDVDGNCRKQYCGARAALDLEFSYNARVKKGKSQTTLLPRAEKTLCFSRGYTTSHMQKNPDQLISYAELALTKTAEGKNIAVVKASDSKSPEAGEGKEYAGVGQCAKLDAGQAECALNGKNGEFTVQNNDDGSIYLQVKTFLTMAEEGKDIGKLDPHDGRLDLNGKDRNNNIFKLYPTVCQEE